MFGWLTRHRRSAAPSAGGPLMPMKWYIKVPISKIIRWFKNRRENRR